MKQKIVNYGKEKRIKILEKSKLLSDEYLKIKDEQQAKTDLLLDAEHLTKHTSTPWCTFKDHDNKYYDLEIEFIAVKKHSASAWCSELVDRYIKWPVDNFFINNYIEPPMYLDHIVAKKFSRLWKSEYRHLDLSGLVELNDSVAEALSSCDSKGSYLYLDGLKEINVKSSEYLLKGNFSTLSLAVLLAIGNTRHFEVEDLSA